MKIKPEKKCKVCRSPATCSVTTLISTVGHKPRSQKGSTGVTLCSRCIRLWTALQNQVMGRPIAEALSALTERYKRLLYIPKPEERVDAKEWSRQSPETDEVALPPVVKPKKKRVENPDAIRVRLSKASVRRACDVIEQLEVPVKPQEDRDALAALLGRLQEAIK